MFNITLGVSVFALIIGFLTGYKYEANQYSKFRMQVEINAKVAADEAKQKEAEYQRITKETSSAYESKIAAIKSYYGGLLYRPSSGLLPKISLSTPRINESPANNGLAEACAETTTQLITLQDWITQIEK